MGLMAKKYRKQNPRIRQLKEERPKERPEIKPIETLWIVKENRIGVFGMSAVAMEKCAWEVWQQFTQNFMIIGAKQSPDKLVFQFMAFSPLFEKHSILEQNTDVPEYQLQITIDEEKKKVKVTAKKLKQSKIISDIKNVKIVGKDGKELKI